MGTVTAPVPVAGLAANFSPMPRIAPPPLGSATAGGVARCGAAVCPGEGTSAMTDHSSERIDRPVGRAVRPSTRRPDPTGVGGDVVADRRPCPACQPPILGARRHDGVNPDHGGTGDTGKGSAGSRWNHPGQAGIEEPCPTTAGGHHLDRTDRPPPAPATPPRTADAQPVRD